MKRHIYIVLILFISCSRFTKIENKDGHFKLIQGSWVSEQDRNWKLFFENNRLLSIYQKDTTVYHFSIESKSCDIDYTTLELTFLKTISKEEKEIFCYEITGLSDTFLAYRYTVNGHLITFVKIE